jgi:choline transport protein
MRTSESTPTEHGEATELGGGGGGGGGGDNTGISTGEDKTVYWAVKDTYDVDSEAYVEDPSSGLVATNSTSHDVADMRRMGKGQQLIRRFRFFSVTAFVAIATAAWEIGLFLLTPGLVDGGRAGLVWNSLWNFIGFAPVYLSMAEMASMAPIAGAQYHWVSEFAPEKWQRSLSYLTGWTSTIAWQAGNAMGIFLVGSLVQTIILVNNESYPFPSWQGTLLAIASCVVAYVGNVYGNKILPHWQIAVFAIHVVGFVGYIVPVWLNAPKATHYQVWGEFQNQGEWSSVGLAVLVGQLSGISQQVGIDTVKS